MEDLWDNWFSDLDTDIDGTFDQCQTNPFVNIDQQQRQQQPMLSSKSVAETHTLQYPSRNDHHINNHSSYFSKSKRSLNFEEREREREGQGTKRNRSASEAQDHVISERRRRQQMAERFIALAAIIPGLKKIDKASVLREAISYVKQLQERITVLEQEKTERKTESSKSMICIRKLSETNSNDDHQSDQVLPDVEAIGLELEKEVFLRIHCGKRKGILLKLLTLLENIHLSVASSSVLPFGKNTLHITIVAQMGEEYNLKVNELVKSLRRGLLKLYDNMEL